MIIGLCVLGGAVLGLFVAVGLLWVRSVLLQRAMQEALNNVAAAHNTLATYVLGQPDKEQLQ